MPNSFVQFPDLLTREYFYDYSEPHRRRPTIFEVPALTIHTATYFSEDGPATPQANTGLDEDRFKLLLMKFLGWVTWARRPYGADPKTAHKIDVPFITAFARYLRPHIDKDDSDRDQVLAFECAKDANSPLAVRIEVHKEYFSLTLFYRLDIRYNSQETVICAEALSPVIPAILLECPSTHGDRGVLDTLFDTIHDRLLFHVNSPELQLFATIEALFPRCTFANFHGCTVPVIAFGQENAPSFCAPWDGVLDNADYAQAQGFLAKMWPQLQRTVFGQSDDVIACYLQDGHAMYVSSLGSQSSPRDIDDLRYVLFFDDDQQMPPPPGGLTPDEVQRQRNWRMSRLIYRLHEAGTLRLAGLRKLRQLRSGMAELTRIEHQVVRKAWPSYIGWFFGREVRRATEKLFKLSASLGEPIQNRLTRSSYYFMRSQAQVSALGVKKIPGWQSYSEFLERRIYNTYHQIGAMGPRIDRLLRFIQTQNDALQSTRSALWQVVGAVAALIVLPDYLGDVLSQLGLGDWKFGFYLGFFTLIGAFAVGSLWWGFRALRQRRKRARAMKQGALERKTRSPPVR
jgi:hypothetical protein